jgi:SAM-dependent methyltransferase
MGQEIVLMDAMEIPLPPDELMIAVANHANHADFARSRINGPAQMLADLRDAGIDPSKLVDVLDFGCGCGRFLAGWVMRGARMQLRGCDYNPALVQWCNEYIPGVDARVNTLGEKIPFPDSSFDLIYLLSVFTHLTVAEQERLVAEFRRILRPGGYVYVTFHGDYFHPTMFPRVEGAEEIFRGEGFLIAHQDMEGQNDCWTLHSPQYLSALFRGFIPLKHFRSLDRGPTDIAAWQDSLIFQVH